MGQVLKRENVTVVIREYQEAGKTKKVYKTIGELVTMQGDDGSTYQFGEMWGPTGSTNFSVFDQKDKDDSQAPTAAPQAPMAAPAAPQAPVMTRQQVLVKFQSCQGQAAADAYWGALNPTQQAELTADL